MLVFTGVIVVLLLSAGLLGWFMQDKITQKILTAINKQVTVPVKVNGGIHLSLITHFPYASLTFKDLVIDDKLRKDKKLLKVEEFSLLCNLFSLFGDKIELTKIFITNGDINIYKDEHGNANYEIIKPSQDTSSTSSSLAVQLKKAEVKNVHFTYNDNTQYTFADVDVKEILLKGDFSSKAFDLTTSINAMVNNVTSSDQQLIAKRKIKAEIVLAVNNDNAQYTFKKSAIDIDGSEFGISGFFTLLKAGTQVDFKLINEGKNIQKLIGLIPEKYRTSFAEAEGSGAYLITANVKGMINKSSFPHVDVSADIKNSELKLGRYNKLLKKVNATAKYEMDEKGTSNLVISNFNCMLNESPFNFKLSILNLSDPSFDFFAHGVFHVSELSTFIPDSVIRDFGGTITFNNFHIKGRKKDFSDIENSTLTGSGEFKFGGVEFQQNGTTYGNINGLMKYNDQVIEVDNVTTNFLSTEASFTGDIHHLLAFAYNLSVNRNANNVVLVVNGALKIKTLNLSGIIDTYNKKNQSKAAAVAAATGKIDVREVMNMQGNIDIQIEKFLFRKIEFDNLQGNIQVSPGIIQCNDVQMQGMDGNIKANGRLSFGDDYSMNMSYDIRAVNLNVTKIFSECENFGQTTLTDKHLKGTLTAAISFNSKWNNYSQLDANSLNAIIDFDIANGELIKFEPLRAASKFIRVTELQDIKFAKLANTIKIANQRMDIPQFEIESSALNLMIEGYHYFNNTVDYHFKINLHKLLAQKFNRKLDNIEYMEDDPYEGLNLYLSMTGDLANPKIKLDKKASRKKIQEDFKKEKENLKNLINNKADIIDENERKREDKYFNVKSQPQFMDFDSTEK